MSDFIILHFLSLNRYRRYSFQYLYPNYFSSHLNPGMWVKNLMVGVMLPQFFRALSFF